MLSSVEQRDKEEDLFDSKVGETQKAQGASGDATVEV